MKIQLSNVAYDKLKSVAQIWLPALGTLYVALALIWGAHIFPAADDVSKTVIAVDTFLGVILGFSTSAYNASGANFDGIVALQDHPAGGAQVKITGLDPESLLTKNAVTFKVVDQTTPEAPDVAAQPAQQQEVPPGMDPRLLR